ncbi:autoinducer binding domain-containing protein [Candidatus Odyssella thessalonicensis]|uniref:autoinducer binding domain-containing protein n=1 Tax=Candidatus Odyssella thessalonicensis TaxID=84647 RepID=UPI000225B792|nr:autoinducer binding domain-containing protein [Candidatus Odyssella thessalonicensis]
MKYKHNPNKKNSEVPIYPSQELIKSILYGIPYQYFTLYLKIEKDIYYDPEHYEVDMGLQLLNCKLTDKEIFTNYPTEWQYEYFDREILDYDPVLLHGCHTLGPYTWGRYEAKLPHLNSTDLKKLLKQSSNYGIENGISVPIGMGINIYGIFTLTFDNTLILQEDMIYQIAYLLHNLGTYIISYEPPTPLRPHQGRERIMLLQSYKALKQQSQYISHRFQKMLMLNNVAYSNAINFSETINMDSY